MTTQTIDQLLLENEDLHRRLEEVEEALRAIHGGEVDAILVEAESEQVYTLETADKPYRLLVEQMPQGAATLTVEGTILYCNRRFADLLKRPLLSLLGKPIHDLIATDSRPFFESLMRDGQATEVQGEVFLKRADGTLIPVYLGVSALREGAFGLCLMVTDLTEQRHYEELKRTQQALRVTSERLELAQQAGRIGTFEWDILTGAVSWSATEEELFGLPAGGFGGKYENWKQALHPEDRVRAEVDVLRAIAERTELDTEFRIVRPDGEMRWIAAKGKVFYGNDGEPLRMVGVNLDITERKQSELALRDALAQREEVLALLDTLLEAAPVGFSYLDREYRWVRVNKVAAALDGFPREEHIGRRVSDLLPTVGPKIEAMLQRVLERGEPLVNIEVPETTQATPEEARHWLASYYPVRTPGGQVLGVGALALEITALKRAEQALRQADRRKNEFLATLAHELRSPLAPIMNTLQIIQMRGLDDPELRSSHALILRQTQHLNRLVDDLLDVSRITRGKVELRRQPIELASVIHRAVETSQPLIDANRHQLIVALPPASVQLDADPTRLAQVFANLLTNSAKYMEPGGRIWLSATLTSGESENREVVIRVRDAGVGIAPAMLPKVFDLFTQADRSLHRSQGGLGIGLSLVQSLVQMHGGSVTAFSEGPGKGSEFVVRLPVLVEPTPSPAETAPAEANRGSPALRVLIVDDNHDAAQSLAILLRCFGHDAFVAHDGRTALEVAKARSPHLIVLDIGLPVMDGFEVCRRLRQEAGLEQVVLVALTGYGQIEDRRRTLEAGFDAHMVKPVEIDQLKELFARAAQKTYPPR